MSKRKFYAVVKGVQPGIYDKWFGPNGAELNIKGFRGAVYKGFAVRADAERWYREHTGETPVSYARAEPDAPAQTLDLPVELQPETALQAGKVIIFTDGACDGNPGSGGYGVVLRYQNSVKELSGGFARTTNNRMELQAAIVALQTLKGAPSVIVYSDSRYVVDGIQKGWARAWQSQAWQRKAGAELVPVKNADLWDTLLTLYERYDATFVRIPGHAGIEDNERCDQLAVAAAQQPDLPPDSGFENPIRPATPQQTLDMPQ